MKKYLALMIIVAMLASMTVVQAEDLGVQVIGDQTQVKDELSFDDIQLGKVYVMDGYAIAAPQEFLIVDCFAQFNKDSDYGVAGDDYPNSHKHNPAYVFTYSNSNCSSSDYHYTSAGWAESGDSAQFVWLRCDITNANKDVKDLTAEIEIKLVYRDEYEYGGWIRLIDYSKMSRNYSDGCVSRYGFEKDQHPAQIVLNPENTPAVENMMTGSYVLGCTLPNYVIADEESPLRMEIKIGDNELIYNIRK